VSGCSSFKGFALVVEADAWLNDELDHISERAKANRRGHATQYEEGLAQERQSPKARRDQAQQDEVAARSEERSRGRSGAGAGGGDRGVSSVG
jgi:hypothetical protein